MFWVQEVPKEEDSELKATVRRNQMMQKLLAVLDSAAALGNGPTLTEFMPEGACRHDLKNVSDVKRYKMYLIVMAWKTKL